MVGVPGEPVDPEDFANPIFETIELDPAESSSALAVQFNHAYAIYVDNTGTGGNNTRFWLEGPDGGECTIGPRAGGSNFGTIRLRTSATTASAATCNIDTAGTIRRSTSSRKYKTDIQPHDIDLDALRSLPVVTFLSLPEIAEQQRWRAAAEAGDEAMIGVPEPRPRRYVGMIAEDMHDAGLHEFVAYHDETGEPDGIMYDRIVLGALQMITKLEERVQQLEAQLAEKG